MVIHESQDGKAIVVIVHGAFEHSGRYGWLINQWNNAGYHVIIGDLPGQGATERRRGHIDSFNDYIDTVQTWVSEARTYDLPVYLFGHSMGGLIVIRTLQKKSTDVVKGVILSSPGLGMKTGPSKPIYYVSKLLNKLTPSVLFNTNVNSQLATRNEDFYLHDESDPLFLHKVSVRWFHEFERAIAVAFNQIGHYPDLPTLFIQAEDDHLVRVQDVEKFYHKLAVQDKMLIIWPNLYHEVFNEPERDEVFEEAKKFVNVLTDRD